MDEISLNFEANSISDETFPQNPWAVYIQEHFKEFVEFVLLMFGPLRSS